MIQKLLTVPEVANILCCSRDRIWLLVRQKKITHIRDGKKILFSHDEISKYIELNSIKASR
jgi:excisionase family DNA binding protein